MEALIIAGAILLALILGAGAEYLYFRNPGEEHPPTGNGYLPADFDFSRDFAITDNRSPGAAGTARGVSTRR